MTNSGKYVDLLTDAGFKAVFGDPANKIIVKDFLNRMLQGERVIEDFEYMNVEQVASHVCGRHHGGATQARGAAGREGHHLQVRVRKIVQTNGRS